MFMAKDGVRDGHRDDHPGERTRGAALAAALLPVALLLVLLVASGCRDDQGAPLTELDRFQQRFDDMPRTERIDSLRALLDAQGQEGAFAAFHLGNTYYAAAADTAAEHGWNHAFTRAHLDSAEVYLDRAIARDSTFVEAYVNLGSLYDDRANIVTPGTNRNEALGRAEELYQRALAIAPHDEKARCNLGSLYLRQRRTMDAKEQFLKVLDHNPESALAHYNLAIMFAEAKIYREAIREWELAAKYDPDGDIGERSRDNVEIVKQLQESEPPDHASH